MISEVLLFVVQFRVKSYFNATIYKAMIEIVETAVILSNSDSDSALIHAKLKTRRKSLRMMMTTVLFLYTDNLLKKYAAEDIKCISILWTFPLIKVVLLSYEMSIKVPRIKLMYTCIILRIQKRKKENFGSYDPPSAI